MNIVVVHHKRSSQPNTIYVGRPHVLGNPFSHLTYAKGTELVPTVDDAVSKYREWLLDRINTSITVCDALNHIINIGNEHGTVHLACWCKDELNPSPKDHACHADVIREVIQSHLSGSL